MLTVLGFGGDERRKYIRIWKSVRRYNLYMFYAKYWIFRHCALSLSIEHLLTQASFYSFTLDSKYIKLSTRQKRMTLVRNINTFEENSHRNDLFMQECHTCPVWVYLSSSTSHLTRQSVCFLKSNTSPFWQ